MNILLVNDDGIMAEGINTLAHILKDQHRIYIVAPATEQSGMSQALSFQKDVRVDVLDPGTDFIKKYAVHGTPADCSKLALEILLKNPEDAIDLVISGINNGANLGTDLLYSGTVGAAIEAYMHGVPALAVSRPTGSSIAFTDIATVLAGHLSEFMTKDQFIYNINFPFAYRDGIPQFHVAKQGYRVYDNEFDIVADEGDSIVYHLAGRAKNLGNNTDSDITLIDEGYITITPLTLDRTHLRKFNLNK